MKKDKNYPNARNITARNLVSSTDMTGMLPAMPEDEEYSSAYTELSDIPKATAKS